MLPSEFSPSSWENYIWESFKVDLVQGLTKENLDELEKKFYSSSHVAPSILMHFQWCYCLFMKVSSPEDKSNEELLENIDEFTVEKDHLFNQFSLSQLALDIFPNSILEAFNEELSSCHGSPKGFPDPESLELFIEKNYGLKKIKSVSEISATLSNAIDKRFLCETDAKKYLLYIYFQEISSGPILDKHLLWNALSQVMNQIDIQTCPLLELVKSIEKGPLACLKSSILVDLSRRENESISQYFERVETSPYSEDFKTKEFKEILEAAACKSFPTDSLRYKRLRTVALDTISELTFDNILVAGKLDDPTLFCTLSTEPDESRKAAKKINLLYKKEYADFKVNPVKSSQNLPKKKNELFIKFYFYEIASCFFEEKDLLSSIWYEIDINYLTDHLGSLDKDFFGVIQALNSFNVYNGYPSYAVVKKFVQEKNEELYLLKAEDCVVNEDGKVCLPSETMASIKSSKPIASSIYLRYLFVVLAGILSEKGVVVLKLSDNELMKLIWPSLPYIEKMNHLSYFTSFIEKITVPDIKLTGAFYDCESYLSKYQSHLKECANLWASQEFGKLYSPYVCLCQSSGTGKTKLMYELSAKEIVIYMCLRPKDASGVPPRSPIADLFLRLQKEEEYRKFYYSVLIAFLERKSFVFQQDMLDTGESNPFWKRVRQLYEDTSNTGWSESIQDLWLDIKTKFQKDYIIFVIDEASNMLKDTRFTDWRRFLSFFGGVPCVHVLMDTSSKITNFLPPASRDPSSRLLRREMTVLSPLYFLPTVRIAEEVTPKKILVKKGELNCDFTELVTIGRPLISAFFEKICEEPTDPVISLKKVILFLGHKLAEGKRIETSQPQLLVKDVNLILALAGCRFPITFSDSTVNEALIAKHMAMLTFVSKERNVIHGKYLPEPLLQEAACQIMWQAGIYEDVVKRIYEEVISSLMGFDSVKGDIGELCAAIFLQYVFDLSVIKWNLNDAEIGPLTNEMNTMRLNDIQKRELELPTTFFSFPVDVPSYFSMLLGDEIVKDLPEIFKTCYVSFTKTMVFNAFPSKELLLAAWKQRCAILCRRNHFAVDIIIPMATSMNPSEPSHFIPFYIQVKNTNGKFDEIESIYKAIYQHNSNVSHWDMKNVKYNKMGPHEKDPFISLLIQAGPGGVKIEEVSTEPHQPFFIIHSISLAKVFASNQSTTGTILGDFASCDIFMKAIYDSFCLTEFAPKETFSKYETSGQKLANCIPPQKMGLYKSSSDSA